MNELTNTTVSEAAEFLKNHDDFHILCHANPDGDTFGCGYGLCRALRKLGKRASVKCAEPLSVRFGFMSDGMEQQEFSAKTVVSVDIADKKLMGELEEIYGDKVMLAVDHHVSHIPFAEKRLIEPFAAAACETVYEVIKALGVEIDSGMASCLYTGLATDTGCFRYPNVTPRTHIIAAELMRFDYDFGTLNYNLFEMKTRARIELEQTAIGNMNFFAENRAAYVVLTGEMLSKVDIEDVNGIAALPRQIEGVEVGIVLKEKKPGVWKASLRSQNKADVQEICKRFGGGGHMRAAGCTFECPLDEAIKLLTEAVTAALA